MPINDTNITSDNFWLNIAAETAYSSSEKRSKSVENLKATITWAFGLFSASGFLVILFGAVKEYNTQALIFFGITFALLTIAYVVASSAEYPVVQEFNSNAPLEIKSAFSNTVKKQSHIFKWAAAITSVGFFFLTAGILFQTGTFKKNTTAPSIKKSSLNIKASIEKKGKAINIPITIMADRSQLILLSLINNTDNAGLSNAKNILHSQYYYTDSVGRLYHSYNLPNDSIKSFFVQAVIKESPIADTVVEHVYTVSVLVK